jgi:hypothetical protein
MDEAVMLAISPDRRRKLVAVQRPDGLFAIHEQRLLDLDVRGEYNDPAQVPFPQDGEAILPDTSLLDDTLDGIYGSFEDAEREAQRMVFSGWPNSHKVSG